MNNYDPFDTRGQAIAKEEEDLRKEVVRENELADLKALMSSARGRRFIWRILSVCNTFEPTFSTNALLMANSEGRRFVGAILYRDIQNHCYEHYQAMVKENVNAGSNGNNGPKSN